MAEVLKNPEPDLADLAKQIDAAHIEVAAALLTGVQRAAEVGHLLEQAKVLAGHGRWETWVTENTAFSPRAARYYMQTSKSWAKADKAKRLYFADLGLSAMLIEIAEPRPTPADEPAEREDAAIVRHDGPTGDDAQADTVSGGPEEHRIGAIMKSVRESEVTSRAPRESQFLKSDRLEFRRSENLDAAKRAYLKLDKADRQEFQNWVAEGASAPVGIIEHTV